MVQITRLWGKWLAAAMMTGLASLIVASLALAQSHYHPLPGPVRAPQSPDVGDNALATSGPVVLTAQEQAILARKQYLAQEFALVQAGKISSLQFQRDWTSFVQSIGATSQVAMSTPHTALCPITRSGANLTKCDLGPHTIKLPQESQINRYYCGPAAVEEALIALHATRGPRGENLLAAPFPATGQHILAGPDYLATDLNIGTNWWSGVVPHTLNAWQGSHYYVAINGPDMGGYFSLNTYIRDLMLDVAAGRPILGGVRMDPTPSEPHLIGFPTNQRHYHWISIMGYSRNGDETIYADSVHGDTQFWWWAENVPAYGTVSTETVMYPLLGTYGYVW